MSQHNYAQQLRKQATYAERILWDSLREKKVGGFKFSFQVPIGKYIADFCCRSHRLIIEIDGASHLDRERADQERELALIELGYAVIRFTDQEIHEDLPVVLIKILDAPEKRPQFRY